MTSRCCSCAPANERHHISKGLQARSVASLPASVDSSDTLESAGLAAEVAVALRISIGAADHEIHRARRLSGHLHQTLAATIGGDLTYRHAGAMVSATRHVDDPQTLAEVETRVLTRATRTTAGELSSHALRVIASVDPAGFDRRHQALRRTADVTLDPTPDAMAYLTAYLPLVDGVAVQTAIENHARAAKAAGDPKVPGRAPRRRTRRLRQRRQRGFDLDVDESRPPGRDPRHRDP